MDELTIRNSDGWCADTVFSEMLHPGKRCYRQLLVSDKPCHSADQLCFDDEGVTDSPDLISPALERRSDGYCRFSLRCTIGHLIADVLPSLIMRHVVIVLLVILLYYWRS